jgi:hypothetical protein
LIRLTMSELEARLDPSQFGRIHRSAIVNIDHVKEVRSEHDDYTSWCKTTPHPNGSYLPSAPPATSAQPSIRSRRSRTQEALETADR